MKAEEITNLILAELEKGVIPWRKPWTISGLAPTSLQTGKPYRGINALLLSLEAHAKGYDSHLWITYKQAQAMGGNIAKGSKGTRVVFWKKLEGKLSPEQLEGAKEGELTLPKNSGVMMMKSFTVFHFSQTEGLELPAKYAPKPRLWDDSEAIGKLWEGYANAPELVHAAQGQAFYTPSADRITLPPKEAFPTLRDYAETLFHEATHSTGHASRLDRFSKGEEKPAPFGSDRYAREELIAEIGACMLMSHAGIEPDQANAAAYCGSWLKVLGDDKRLIITAAQRAAKAFDHIVGKPAEENQEQEQAEAAA